MSTRGLAEQFDALAVIALYADHGTHEQFHSEFKTDMDLERLPSGKFDTNFLVCAPAALAMNILRLMAQDVIQLFDDKWAQAHGRVSRQKQGNTRDSAPGDSRAGIRTTFGLTLWVNPFRFWAHEFR